MFIKRDILSKASFTVSTMLLIGALLAVVPFISVLNMFSEKTSVQAILPLLPLVLLLIFSYDLAFYVLILTLFIAWSPIPYFGFPYFYFPLLVISFLVVERKFSLKGLDNIVIKSFFVFILTVIPSYTNAINLGNSLFVSTHLLFFLLLIILILSSTKDYNRMKNYLKAYVGITTLNSVLVSVEAMLTGKRVFGLSSIMYVDYVGIAIVLVYTLILFSEKKERYYLVPTLIILALGSIFAQTRNTWINIGLVLFTITIYLWFKGKIHIERRSLSRFLFAFVMIAALVVGIALASGGKPFDRKSTKSTITEEGLQDGWVDDNSFITRFFIWHTAYNGFSQHPYIGMGIYSFPKDSKVYSTLPKIIYDKYVKGLSPHQSYFAITAEAGILGLLGFIFLQISIIRFSFQNMRLARTKGDFIAANLISWTNVYLAYSNFMTDCWLWGHGIFLWGIVVGLTLAYRKIITEKYADETTAIVSDKLV